MKMKLLGKGPSRFATLALGAGFGAGYAWARCSAEFEKEKNT
jgi:hypothetical protein